MTRFLLFFPACCAFCLSFVLCVYIKDEEPPTKPPLQVEKLPWLSFFDREKSPDSFGKRDQIQMQRRASDFTSHSSLCPPGETGQFPYPPDCKRFINCWKGRGSVQVCAPGTLFNSETFECDFPGKVKCEDGFGGLGDQFPVPTGERYVRFPHQRPEITQNPRVARKNQEQQLKSDSIPAKPYPGRPPYFGPSHLKPPTKPANQSEGREVRPQCPLGVTGLYPHPYDCTKFLKCWSGITFIQNCGPGTFFNHLISACDHPSNVPCTHEENYQPLQPIQPEAEIEIEDLQIPEESVQHEQYQDVNLGVKPVKEAKNTVKDLQSPNYEDDDVVTTPKNKIGDLEELETETSHRKPKIINIAGHPNESQVGKIKKEPAPYLIPPQYDVYGNRITPGDKNHVQGVQPSQASRQEISNSGYPFHPFFFTYPPQGPYSDQEKLGLKGPKIYYGYALNKNLGPDHPQHPYHSPQMKPVTWLVPPPFQNQFFSHYAPNHPFFPQSQISIPHNLPQVPYYPYSVPIMCATSQHEPNAPKCEPSAPFYKPEDSQQSNPPTRSSAVNSQHQIHPIVPKPIVVPDKQYPTAYEPHLHTNFNLNVQNSNPPTGTTENKNIKPQTQASLGPPFVPELGQSSVFMPGYNFEPQYGGIGNENPQVQIRPTLPKENQLGFDSDFTPHQYLNSQFQPKPQTVQSKFPQKLPHTQTEFPYHQSGYAPEVDNQNLKPQSVNPSYPQPASNQSSYLQLQSSFQTNRQKPTNTQSRFPYYSSNYASKDPKRESQNTAEHASNQNSPGTSRNPIYYYPMYPLYPASYFPQTPPNTPTQKQPTSAQVDKNIDYLYRPSKPVYRPILPNLPQQSDISEPFDNKNYIDKGNEPQPSDNYPIYQPTKTNEFKQTNAEIHPEGTTPIPAKTNKPHSNYIKSEPPKQHLIEDIGVRTKSESSEDDAERIVTTQFPPKRKGTEKVDEFFVNTKKPLFALPDKYSQPEETTKKTIQPQTEEKPKKKPQVKVKQTPPNGQQVRLRNGASHLDGYLEMKDSKSKWGLVCDGAGEWTVAEAKVACRELGFIRGAELSWQGYPIKSNSEDLHVAVNGINCTGTETTLSECQVVHTSEKECDIGRNAVGVRCFDNLASHCQPKEILYNQHCYKLHEKENPDDPWITTEEASEQCKKFGGKLVDITSQFENDFLSEWLIKKHPDVTAVLTGGIGISVLGRPMWLWEGTNDPMVYERWWSGWSGDQNIPKGSIDGPLCIILRKTFSCSDNEGQKLETIVEEETCSADYFFWDVEDCGKLRTSVFICERPMDDIGCVVGNGEGYVGTANTTASGLPCLPWDHSKVVEGLARRGQAHERSSRLAGHNYCRNLGNPDRHPWCFVEGRGNSEYCAIPQCWDSGSYSRSSGQWSSCDANHFECKPGECVKQEWVCDGQRDCLNGRDEEACKMFVREFSRELDRKMNGKGNEKWPNTNENTCAKLCLENKNFKCRSFSYHAKSKDCLLSDSNIGLSGQVVDSRGWVYHERTSDSLRCSLDNGLFACKSGKCINISNVCDGKKNCEDGSDERDCGRLGYQIRLAGGPEKHKGRIEIKILGKWGVVCDDMFDMRDAEVVCRELGFRLGAAEVFKHSEFPVENPLFLVDHLDCRGNETSVRECSFPGWGKHNCGPEEIAGVACRVPGVECPEGQWQCKGSKECISLAYLCDELKDCDDGSDEDKFMCGSPIQIRLSGGPNATSGRLEIRRFDIWGTVCHDDFSAEAGHSVCNLLGFNSLSAVKKAAYFGEGKGPIWLDSGLCFVNETNLDECSKHMGFQNNCKHDEDVSLICSQHYQKSSGLRPIAASSADDDGKRNEDKLRQILISECSGKPKNKVGQHKFEKVVGGNDVTREALPWQASVRVRSGSGKSVHWCGAIVISPYHVLTAGHCLRDYNKAAYFVRVGDYDTKVPDPHEREFGIEHLYMHPDFNKNINLNNDIGLIKIKGEIPLGEYIKPACLAPSTDIYTPGTNCSVSGWGSVSSHSAGYARTLRRAFIPILEPSVCRAPFVYGQSLSEGMFCAGHLDGGVDSCQGDSGGPFICQHLGREYLFGITSWGHGCGRANKPGVYTNVAFYAHWIQQKIHASLS